MFIFGHAGITLGLALLLGPSIERWRRSRVRPSPEDGAPPPPPTRQPGTSTLEKPAHLATRTPFLRARRRGGKALSRETTPSESRDNASPLPGPGRLAALAQRIDLRLLLLGSILPDIIDKPLGDIVLADTIGCGRIFAHSFLFFLTLSIGGALLYQTRKKLWPLVLAFGAFTHLILDQMWEFPQNLLWPFLGVSLERCHLDFLSTAGIRDMIDRLVSNPALGLPEIFGMCIIAWLIWELVRKRQLRRFLRYGEFPG